MTKEEILELFNRRKFLLKEEKEHALAYEEDVLHQRWEDASRKSNRISHMEKARRRIEEKLFGGLLQGLEKETSELEG
jgi:hypothetical protein